MGSPALGNRNNGQRLGITEPISLGGPTEYDVIKTGELEKVVICTLNLNSFCLKVLSVKYADYVSSFCGCLVLARCRIV